MNDQAPEIMGCTAATSHLNRVMFLGCRSCPLTLGRSPPNRPSEMTLHEVGMRSAPLRNFSMTCYHAVRLHPLNLAQLTS